MSAVQYPMQKLRYPPRNLAVLVPYPSACRVHARVACIPVSASLLWTVSVLDDLNDISHRDRSSPYVLRVDVIVIARHDALTVRRHRNRLSTEQFAERSTRPDIQTWTNATQLTRLSWRSSTCSDKFYVVVTYCM